MENPIVIIVASLVVGLIGLVLGYFLSQYIVGTKLKTAQAQAERTLAEAEAQKKDILIQAKEDAIQLRNQAEAEMQRRSTELRRQEERLQKRQEGVDRRFESVESRERALSKRQSAVDRRTNEIDKLYEKQVVELRRISGLSQEEAKELLLQEVEKDARPDMARIVREIEAEAKAEGERRARKIVTDAIQRVATDQVAETVVSAVPLPGEDMKGRIIGRQGRNIRAFENATGIDVIVDDTPEAIILSGFDPVRREIARVAMTKLITDGRIHPARIEKTVEKARQEVEGTIIEEGERAALEAGVHGLHPEIIKLLGRLRYRTSYGQNQHQHAVECAHIAGILAAELGADVRVAKEGALLHDIGKAVDHEIEGPHALIGADIAKRCGVHPKVVNIIASHHHEVEGPHALIGADIAKRCGVHPKVVNIIASHHHEVEQDADSLEAIIVESADAISGARPGARRESLETYVKRIKALEEVANSFGGVNESYAIQAGREIRIIVRPEEIDDYTAINLSKDIARKVEESLEYPGQIKVTVIRETRAVDYAK